MAEETKKEKKEVVYVEGTARPVGTEDVDFIVTSPGYTKDAATRYNVFMKIPKTDEEASERYGCKLADLIAAGVRQLSTRVNF